jgi:hypothetical protein
VAELVWCQHPAAIECDLADRGFDIFAWHAGRMSSRRLLVLLEYAPEMGPYKTALRGGKWPEWMQMIAEIHKEVALDRASNYVGGDHEYKPKVFVDPTDRERLHREEVEAEQFVEEAQAELYEMAGFT